MHLFRRWSRHHERHRHHGFDGRFGPFGPHFDAGPCGQLPPGPAAGVWPFSAFAHWHGHRHGAGHHHGHHGHGHGFGPGLGADGHRHKRLQARISAFLDLSESQQATLAQLLDQVRARRRALRGLAGGQDVGRLVEGDTFARDAAQQLLEAQIDALRSAVPSLVQALGDFFDSLDFDQQQALRFMMRRMRRRAGRRGDGGRGGDRGEHRGDHDADGLGPF
ncbi:LTXXQ motif family protein [Roseateles sp. YR242]|uniref:Spy/CpxP family protein refolding chaperone n=1 Tax=Roseateles sp. YR242 TaxID=1855305 RepID=UPI0008D102AE|nr:Spy/CpxP family protein refolding chaperone [Roseateles sp. YR242]SEL67368.1 LTXXQ motif family protein [Roseateles sp. YR242]